MRIAQIAPLWETVPPKEYGGTERIVYFLIEQLIQMGHDVTLFASGDSRTSGRLETVWPTSFRKNPPPIDPSVLTLANVGKAFESGREFDIIHNHIGIQALPLIARSNKPSLTTIHDGFTKNNLAFFNRYRSLPYVTISNSQRIPEARMNFYATVYHGLPLKEFPFSPSPDTANPYLAFVGRMAPEKAPHLAIEVARKTGWRLKMAAKIAAHERAYWKGCVEPLVDGDQIQFLGELGHDAKCELMGGAAAVLFPIQWREPFGLVLIESLACGTPVIAFGKGSVPEIIQHGKTGAVVNSLREMIESVRNVGSFKRADCRAQAENRFSDSVMTANYLALYDRLLESREKQVDSAACLLSNESKPVTAMPAKLAY